MLILLHFILFVFTCFCDVGVSVTADQGTVGFGWIVGG